ncbi:hypothetical protein PC129_g24719 [Phytophthora cactorum]|uniref:Uncharacterized protein n=1 Tax=Phytophthora cactorum TaxID=29920 RepID=A0A8T1GV40_9STRA|nr:hypothetical protein PC129_g24719 [Phytophthora cactorum]
MATKSPPPSGGFSGGGYADIARTHQHATYGEQLETWRLQDEGYVSQCATIPAL